ncbi:MAG: MFS transporter [Steroidobacteraceae bacterium]
MNAGTNVAAHARPARLSISYPWALIGLLWMVAFMNAADRSIVVAVMPQLRAEFGLTTEQLALINSAFFWIYAVAAFGFGRLGDGSRRSWVIIGGLAFWSVATGLVSLSSGFATFVAFRSLVALGEATYYPTGTALISDWHRQMRGRALSIHQTAVVAGTGLGALIAGILADRFGWRVPFLIFGAIGLLWCLALLKWLRDAPVCGALASQTGTPSPIGPLRIMFRQPPALFFCGVFFLMAGAGTGVAVWGPTYVHDALGRNLADSAFYGAATVSIAPLLTVPLGGLLADWLAVRTPAGRSYTLAIGLALAGVLLMPLIAADSAFAIGLVLFASFAAKGLADGCIYAALHDVVPRAARASAVGLMTMCGFIGAGITPILVAKASKMFGMAASMASLSILYLIAAGILLAIRGMTGRAVLDTRSTEEGRAA